jgi:hypothetical protein
MLIFSQENYSDLILIYKECATFLIIIICRENRGKIFIKFIKRNFCHPIPSSKSAYCYLAKKYLKNNEA